MARNLSNSAPVILIGGGFSGLTTALALSRFKNRPPILVIEPRRKFVFSPLLYELLSGELKKWEIAPTYESLLTPKGIALIQERVTKIDPSSQTVETSSGLKVAFSYLIIGTGSELEDFGIKGVKEYALKFQSLEDVCTLRKLVTSLKQSTESSKVLTVVGAGPTGVELACKLADLLKGAAKIQLIELGGKILASSKAFNREQAEKALTKRSIMVNLYTKVIEITANEIKVESNSSYKKVVSSFIHNGVIWTAGTKPVVPLFTNLSVSQKNRISINSCLQVQGFKNILALGDAALNKENDWPLTAQVAIQQGESAAQTVMALRAGKVPSSFKFNDLGEMLSLGLGEATITGMGLTISGPLAFQIRRMAYLTRLPVLSLGLKSASAWLLDS